jgi:hypothetical protein
LAMTVIANSFLLLLPTQWKVNHQRSKRESWRLASINDSFQDLRCEEATRRMQFMNRGSSFLALARSRWCLNSPTSILRTQSLP